VRDYGIVSVVLTNSRRKSAVLSCGCADSSRQMSTYQQKTMVVVCSISSSSGPMTFKEARRHRVDDIGRRTVKGGGEKNLTAVLVAEQSGAEQRC